MGIANRLKYEELPNRIIGKKKHNVLKPVILGGNQ